MDLSTLLAAMVPLGILIYWLTDLEKNVTNKNVNAILTKLSTVAIAFLAVVVYAHSSIELGGAAGKAGHDLLSSLSWGDQLLLCVLFAATAGTGSDILRTFNNSDPTVKPTLIPPSPVEEAV